MYQLLLGRPFCCICKGKYETSKYENWKYEDNCWVVLLLSSQILMVLFIQFDEFYNSEYSESNF